MYHTVATCHYLPYIPLTIWIYKVTVIFLANLSTNSLACCISNLCNIIKVPKSLISYNHQSKINELQCSSANMSKRLEKNTVNANLWRVTKLATCVRAYPLGSLKPWVMIFLPNFDTYTMYIICTNSSLLVSLVQLPMCFLTSISIISSSKIVVWCFSRTHHYTITAESSVFQTCKQTNAQITVWLCCGISRTNNSLQSSRYIYTSKSAKIPQNM